MENYMEKEGLSPYEATKKAMQGLTGALIATSLVLAAVFVPVSFLGGITGLLYSAVCHYDCGVGIDFGSGGPDVEPGDVRPAFTSCPRQKEFCFPED